jgi:hypothetical protein
VHHDLLDGSQILEFYEAGFICPGGVFNASQVDELRALVDRACAREKSEGRLYDLLDPALWPEVDPADPVHQEAPDSPEEPRRHVDFLFNLWRVEPEIREFIFDTTLARWAAQLIGARRVRLLEDNALWKEPFSGGELKWHQDYPYWPLAQPNAVTAWIALDDVDAENGAMSVAVASHLTGERLPAAFGTGRPYLQEQRPATVKPIEDPKSLGLDVETLSLQAGEVSFHSALLWHTSGPNDSSRQRRAIVIRYVGDGTIWLGSQRYHYNYSDEEVGLEVGEPIGGEFFPLVPN